MKAKAIPPSPAPPQNEEVLFREDCPCPKRGCELHGRCVECRAKHGRKGHLPRCEC